MHHALIIAGGSGTRLWPMSRSSQPKQLIPFIGGKSLLQISVDRVRGLVPDDNIHICAGEAHRQAMLPLLPGHHPADNFIGEPVGRDTLNAVGLGAAAIASRDPDAVIAVFTADHVIEPVDQFQAVVRQGFALAQSASPTLVTFGIKPTQAATGFGYLELGHAIAGTTSHVVSRFKEKPDAATAQSYLDAGPTRYLWNSGMFVWRASTLLDCVRRYAPENHAGLSRVAADWSTPRRLATLAAIYPTLKKISVDYAVMEPASRDPQVAVAALPMNLTWLDVGSWPSFAQTCPHDAAGNAIAAPRHLLMDCRQNLLATNEPGHLLAAVGCENLIIVHTPRATLVCRADRAEDIKKLHELAGKTFGPEMT